MKASINKPILVRAQQRTFMFTEIVSELKKILSSKNILDESKKLEELTNKFNELKNNASSEEDVNQLLAKDLIHEIKSKIKLEIDKEKKAAEKIKEEKSKLIQDLQTLIQTETNIGKAFNELKNIREAFNALNEKLKFEQKSIDKEFTKLLEDFYYNINIYKAIQEHDLKRNQQLKEDILKKLEACSLKSASLELMAETKALKNEWEGIGPVKKELQDEFWNKYRSFLDIIYSNFKDFKASEKIEQEENLKHKKSIINYIQSIDPSRLKSIKDWKSKANKVIKKQEEWKKIGFVPKEFKDEIWLLYKNACDNFFTARNSFFEEQKKVFKQNKKLKVELCNKAEELLKQEDISELTPVFVKMQADWKKIGPVHQRDEQYLWHKFQASCNAFFDKKKQHKQHIIQEKDATNKAKQLLIEKIANSDFTDEDQLLIILKDWWKTNKEHTKKSNELKAKFNKQLIGKTSCSLQDLELKFFDEKINTYAQFNDNGYVLKLEKQFIQDKIQTIHKDLQQYENNLSFFNSDSKNKNSELFIQVEEKIALLNQNLESLKTSLSKINTLLKN